MSSQDYPDACTNCPAARGRQVISWSTQRRAPVFTNPGRAIAWGLIGWGVGSMVHSWTRIAVVTIIAALAGSFTGG